MFDPRDDTRDRGEDGHERAYEGRELTGDPRDVFLHDVDLPSERDREFVLDRDHVYELNGDDARTLATVGAFRVVPERELLDGDDAVSVSDSLDHIREQGLIETVPIGDHDQGIVLTDQGRDLLDANRSDRESDDDDGQAFHAGVLRERELEHDASMYEAFRAEELRIRDEHPGAEKHRRFEHIPNTLREAGYYCTNNSKTDFSCDADAARIFDESSATAHYRNRPAGKPFFAIFNHMGPRTSRH